MNRRPGKVLCLICRRHPLRGLGLAASQVAFLVQIVLPLAHSGQFNLVPSVRTGDAEADACVVVQKTAQDANTHDGSVCSVCGALRQLGHSLMPEPAATVAPLHAMAHAPAAPRRLFGEPLADLSARAPPVPSF